MEQFNPCLRNFVAMGKNYEKALASKSFFFSFIFSLLPVSLQIQAHGQASTLFSLSHYSISLSLFVYIYLPVFSFCLSKKGQYLSSCQMGRPYHLVHSLWHSLYTLVEVSSKKHKTPLIWCRSEDSSLWAAKLTKENVWMYVCLILNPYRIFYSPSDLVTTSLHFCPKTSSNLTQGRAPAVQRIQQLVPPPHPTPPPSACASFPWHTITNPGLGEGRRQTGRDSLSH